jgi:nucleoside-diphosphate-sugar epimerase
MSILVTGGAGFIGRRLVRRLVALGHRVASLDADPGAHPFADLGDRVLSLRGDVACFEQVAAAMADVRAERVAHLAYLIGGNHLPRVAFRANVLGMANVLEAARVLGARHVVYAGSFAAYGPQSRHGEHRAVAEDDPLYPDDQYARHKVANEWQAFDYAEKHGMAVTGVRTSYVTGEDKARGSLHHVRCITEPALGRAVTLPHADQMQCVLHADETAEVFARVLLADAPAHRVYNTGGTTLSLAELAGVVRAHIPDARIAFESRTGARNETYRLDNTRLLAEFDVRYRPFPEQVLQVIQDTRQRAGLPPTAASA